MPRGIGRRRRGLAPPSQQGLQLVSVWRLWVQAELGDNPATRSRTPGSTTEHRLLAEGVRLRGAAPAAFDRPHLGLHLERQNWRPGVRGDVHQALACARLHPAKTSPPQVPSTCTRTGRSDAPRHAGPRSGPPCAHFRSDSDRASSSWTGARCHWTVTPQPSGARSGVNRTPTNSSVSSAACGTGTQLFRRLYLLRRRDFR